MYGILSSELTEPLYDIHNNLFLPLFVGAIVCFVSWFIMSIGIIIMDRKLDK